MIVGYEPRPEKGGGMQLPHMSSHARAWPHVVPVLQGSKYADRLPIGKETVIRGVPAETVRAFYKRWYRPEHMCVVVVGDFDLGEWGGGFSCTSPNRSAALHPIGVLHFTQ